MKSSIAKKQVELKQIIDAIHTAKTVLLSTHRQCDGDGLGSQLAVYHALRKSGKNVQVVNVDETPSKYAFLYPDAHIKYFNQHPDLKISADVCLIFDTNDERMLGTLFEKFRSGCKQIFFLDHHPALDSAAPLPKGSFIDTAAASTGEIAYRLIKSLNIPIDTDIAKALYTSITFDTQLYRYVRNSPTSHRIAAELLEHPIDANEINRFLFGNQTVKKMAFLAKALNQIEYFCDGSVAILKILDKDLFHYDLQPDDARDVIDVVMNIETIQVAALFREDGGENYKLSLRSKGQVNVLRIAEKLGGGGHLYAAGAFVKGNFSDFKKQVIEYFSNQLAVSES